MSKKCSLFLTMTGAVLLFSALLLVLFNYRENVRAVRESELLLAAVEEAIPAQRSESIVSSGTSEAEGSVSDQPAGELSAAMVGDYGCVGIIEIPRLGLKLPVIGEWDYERLKVAPCRQFGSSRTNDLVIAAHNYAGHFGRINALDIGDRVLFTDMDGVCNSYTVSRMETVDAEDTESVRESGYALVLYTCNAVGDARIAVFCERVGMN